MATSSDSQPFDDASETLPPAPASPPAPPANSQAMPALPFAIAVPDLRNGALTNIQQAAPKASMSVLYHWPVMTGMVNENAIRCVEYIIRACYAQLASATGGTPSPAVLADIRKKAIVLGAVRAGATAAFRLVAGDMTPSELVPSGMQISGDRVAQSANGTTSTARWTLAQAMEALTPSDCEAIGVVVYMGMAVPALQGVSLVMTGHHYIPPTYNLFAGIKRQALGSASAETRAWIESMGQDFDDMAFHKACHPIDPTLKREMAKKQDVAHRLRASGHGSAAIRLPAVPSEASGGKASIALARSAAATIKAMGHTIDYSVGVGLMMNLEAAASSASESAACDAVVAWVADNADTLAFCAGIVQQVHEVLGTGRNTILAAYSIKRIMADNPARVSDGIAYARAAAARTRSALESGTYVDPAISM